MTCNIFCPGMSFFVFSRRFPLREKRRMQTRTSHTLERPTRATLHTSIPTCAYMYVGQSKEAYILSAPIFFQLLYFVGAYLFISAYIFLKITVARSHQDSWASPAQKISSWRKIWLQAGPPPPPEQQKKSRYN